MMFKILIDRHTVHMCQLHSCMVDCHDVLNGTLMSRASGTCDRFECVEGGVTDCHDVLNGSLLSVWYVCVL